MRPERRMEKNQTGAMEKILSVCARDCYDTCSLIISLNESKNIHSIKGDPRNPVTRGFTCPRGAKDHERLIKNRVRSPHLRQGDRLEKAGWEEALNAVSRKLARTIDRHGPESVLNLSYAGNMGLLSSGFPQRLWYALGAVKTDGALCSKSGHAALSLHYGESYGIDPVELRTSDLIVFWGFNAAVSSPHMWALAVKARHTLGAKIVVIDPLKTRTAKAADLWIHPRPGTDVALVYGIIHQLISRNLVDQSFIDTHTLGFDELKSRAAEWPLDRVVETTHIGDETIAQISTLYSRSRKSATMIGIGLQKCDQGADQVRAVSFIPALLGIHRGFFYGNSGSFNIDESLVSGKSLAGKTPEPVEQVALADHVAAGKFKFIYVNCMNPAVTLPNQTVFRSGLKRPDLFLTVHETHWTKTARYADVVLPAPTFLEKDDMVLPWCHHFVRYSRKAVPALYDSRDEVWVMQEIAKRLELSEKWLYQEPWEVVESAMENALAQGDFHSLKKGDILPLRVKPKNHYPTPSGRIEFYSSSAERRGFNPLPEQTRPPKVQEHFTLLNSSVPRYTHTQFQEVYGMIPAVVLINPENAGKLNLEEGQIAILENGQGRVMVRTKISDTVPDGVVWCPRPLEGLDGVPINALMTSVPQKIGKGPRFNSTPINIRGITDKS